MGNNPGARSPTHARYVTQVGSGKGSPIFAIFKTVTVRITDIQATWSLQHHDQALNSRADISFDLDRMTLFHFESLHLAERKLGIIYKKPYSTHLLHFCSMVWQIKAGKLEKKEN